MVKLIVWLAVLTMLYRIWKEVRARRNDLPPRRNQTADRRKSRFDSGQIVDADFQEVDEEEKGIEQGPDPDRQQR